MEPDDERHGTIAGYSTHRREGTPQCAACREASRVRETKRKPPTDYELALGPGSWMPRHRSGGVQVWHPAPRTGGAA